MTEPTQTPPEEPAGRELSDEVIVNPDREVKLSNGQRVVVSPWGAKKGHLVLERMDALQPALAAQAGREWNARVLLSAAWDEVIDLITMTLDIERTEIEKPPRDGGWTFEDVCEVTQAVVDVCILRSDGRGALPSLVALVGKMTEVATRTLGPVLARQHERDLKAADISGDKSGNGSDSPTTSESPPA